MRKINIKRNSGITLIALVVTIIVLLILAGISISMLAGQNGILTRSKQAKEETRVGTIQELRDEWLTERKISESIGETPKTLEEELSDLVKQGIITETESETIKNSPNNEITIGSHTISFYVLTNIVEADNIEDWYWTANSDGTVTITGYKGSATEITIPNYINGYRVVSVIPRERDDLQYRSLFEPEICTDQAYTVRSGLIGYKCSQVKKVNISEGIQILGDFLFCACTSLESVVLPDTVTEIKSCCFSGCSELQVVNIPNGITRINENTFSGCLKLSDITLPNSIKSIGYMAFHWSAVTNVNIPNGVESIDWCAFCGTKIKKINIPSSISEINSTAFNYCLDLESIDVSDDNSNYMSENGVLYSKNKTTLILYPAGKNDVLDFTIPNSVESIESDAFQYTQITNLTIGGGVTTLNSSSFDNSNLVNINIPNSVTNILTTFSKCYKLESINVSEENSNYLTDNGVLYNKDQSILIRYPSMKKDITEFTIPKTVTEVGNYAFSECSEISTINIPSSVTTIRTGAFYSWINSQTINFQSTSISNGYSWKLGCKATIKYGVDM